MNTIIFALKESLESLKCVNDIDTNKCVNEYIQKGGYDTSKSFDENKQQFIQYLAFRKCFNKI